MPKIIGAEPLLRNIASVERLGYARRIDHRLPTKCQVRCLTLGHDVWSFVFKGM